MVGGAVVAMTLRRIPTVRETVFRKSPPRRVTSRKCNVSAAAAVIRESNNAVRALIPPPGTDGNYFRSTREPRAFHLGRDCGGRGSCDTGPDRVRRQPGRHRRREQSDLRSHAGNPNSGDCLLGANGADVEAGIADPTVACSRWIQNLAGNGLVWYPISQMVVPGSGGAADGEAMQEACDVTDGTQELYVEEFG